MQNSGWLYVGVPAIQAAEGGQKPRGGALAGESAGGRAALNWSAGWGDAGALCGCQAGDWGVGYGAL